MICIFYKLFKFIKNINMVWPAVKLEELYKQADENIWSVKLEEGGILPTKGSKEAAGYDIYTPVDFTLEPGSSKIIDLKFKMKIKPGYCGLAFPRSGLFGKYDIFITGVIDSDYRGNICAMIKNIGENNNRFVDKVIMSLFLLIQVLFIFILFNSSLRKINGEMEILLIIIMNLLAFFLIGALIKKIRKGGYKFKKGERIGQILITPICTESPKIVDELNETIRGDGRFGSTGK